MDEARRRGKTPPGADPVVEAYKRHIDRTLLREHLKLAPDERLRKLQAFVRFVDGPRGTARRRP
jgi:hypothetical protein